MKKKNRTNFSIKIPPVIPCMHVWIEIVLEGAVLFFASDLWLYIIFLGFYCSCLFSSLLGVIFRQPVTTTMWTVKPEMWPGRTELISLTWATTNKASVCAGEFLKILRRIFGRQVCNLHFRRKESRKIHFQGNFFANISEKKLETWNEYNDATPSTPDNGLKMARKIKMLEQFMLRI